MSDFSPFKVFLTLLEVVQRVAALPIKSSCGKIIHLTLGPHLTGSICLHVLPRGATPPSVQLSGSLAPWKSALSKYLPLITLQDIEVGGRKPHIRIVVQINL